MEAAKHIQQMLLVQLKKKRNREKTAPLKHFHLFPRLPEELRRKIWKAACSDGRLFWLRKPVRRDSSARSSGRLTLPPGSSTLSLHTKIGFFLEHRYPPPTLFFVSREAETEAKATYKPIDCAGDEARNCIIGRRILGSMFKKHRHPSGYRVWFNPKSDIIYLDHETCLGVLVALLKLGLPIQRIALDARNDGRRSCCETAIAKKACLQQFLGKQVDYSMYPVSLVRRFRILHGFTIAGSTEDVFPGCPSLKEVLLFMRTPGPLFDHIIRDKRWGPVGRSRSCWGEVEFQRYPLDPARRVRPVRMTMESYICFLLKTTMSSFPEGDSAWKGVRKAPRFQFAHFQDPSELLMFSSSRYLVWWD